MAPSMRLNEWLPIDRRLLLHRRVLAFDVRDLLFSFLQHQQQGPVDLSFSAFKRHCWDTKGFLAIHFICMDFTCRPGFMAELYGHLLKYLTRQDSLTLQLGAIYALYLVFMTQPPRIIQLPIEIMMTFEDHIRQLATRLNHPSTSIPTDALQILKYMFENGYMQWCTYEPVQDELLHFQQHFDADGAFPEAEQARQDARREFAKSLGDKITEESRAYLNRDDLLRSVERLSTPTCSSQDDVNVIRFKGGSNAMLEYERARREFIQMMGPAYASLNDELTLVQESQKFHEDIRDLCEELGNVRSMADFLEQPHDMASVLEQPYSLVDRSSASTEVSQRGDMPQIMTPGRTRQPAITTAPTLDETLFSNFAYDDNAIFDDLSEGGEEDIFETESLLPSGLFHDNLDMDYMDYFQMNQL